jgi:hypothetical protein
MTAAEASVDASPIAKNVSRIFCFFKSFQKKNALARFFWSV